MHARVGTSGSGRTLHCCTLQGASFGLVAWRARKSDSAIRGPSAYDFMSADGVVDPSLMLERMDSVETIGFRAEVPLFALSFRDKNRFEFRLRSRFVADQQFNYDRDLFAMGWKGNGHPDMIGRPISFSDFGLNAQGYFDHSLSVGAMVTEEKFWLGWGGPHPQWGWSV